MIQYFYLDKKVMEINTFTASMGLIKLNMQNKNSYINLLIHHNNVGLYLYIILILIDIDINKIIYHDCREGK